MRKGLREALMLLAVLGVASGVALVLAEGAIRLLRPQTVWVLDPGLFTEDGEGFYRLRPGHHGRSGNRTEFDHAVTIDEHGLRQNTIDDTTEARERLLVIGDSFAFGVGVEDDETFAALLPEALRDAGSPLRLATLNGGIPGLGLPQQVRWLERHGLDLAPDRLLVAVYLGNDLLDATVDTAPWRIVRGQMATPGSPTGVRQWLYLHSHLFVFAKGAVAPLRQRFSGGPSPTDPAHAMLDVYAHRPTRAIRTGVARTRDALARLAEVAAQRGIPVAAMLIPARVQVDPQDFATSIEARGLHPEAYDAAQPTTVFRTLLAEQRIPTLDLTTAFAGRTALYFPIDRHWTADGHRLAATSLARFLDETWAAPTSLP